MLCNRNHKAYLVQGIRNESFYQSIFLFLNENICCGYSLAASRDAANKYPQHMFSFRNKESISIFSDEKFISSSAMP